MNSKYQQAVALGNNTRNHIVASTDQWTGFLRTAAQNYKYSFKEQLLIYAQKPDATACAEYGTWNKLGRWVKRGTSGIALPIGSDENPKVRYVFDISSTGGNPAAKAHIWAMREEDHVSVLELLQKSCHTTATELDRALIEAAELIASTHLPEYAQQLGKEGVVLSVKQKDKLFRLMCNSSAYMLLHRCGYDSEAYFSSESFDLDGLSGIVLTWLGTSINAISGTILRSIGKEVLLEQSKNTHEKGVFEHGQHEEQRIDLSSGRGLFDPGSGVSESPADRAVREGSPEVHKGESGGLLHGALANGQAERASGGRGSSGFGDGGANRQANEEGRGADGGNEEHRPDEMGRADEQLSGIGTGDHQRGADLRVIPDETEQIKQISEAEEQSPASDFSLSQGDIDRVLTGGSGISENKFRIFQQYEKQQSVSENAAFLRSEYGIGGSYPIAGNMDENHDSKGICISKGRLSNPDARVKLSWPKVAARIGELIKAGRYLNEAEKAAYPEFLAEQKLHAERMAFRETFQQLVREYSEHQEVAGNPNMALNQYVLSDCASQFVLGEKTTFTLSKNNLILPLMRAALGTIATDPVLAERANAVMAQLNSPLAQALEPDAEDMEAAMPVEMEYRYAVGDTLYLHNTEYVVSNIGSSVTLAESQYPLFQESFTVEELAEQMKEEASPFNASLLKPVEIAQEPQEAVSEMPEEVPPSEQPESISEPDSGEIKTVLEVGDVIRFENKQWRITKNDGFMLSADNLNPDDPNSSLSWIGSIAAHEQEHDFEVIEKASELPKEKAEVQNLSFAEQVELFADPNKRTDRYNDIFVCNTPKILMDIGCAQLPMFITQKHLRDALAPDDPTNHKHGLQPEQVKELPAMLEHPILIFDSMTRNDSVVLVSDHLDNENRPIIISIVPNGHASLKAEIVESNFITGAYGKDRFDRYLSKVVEQDKLLFVDKKRSQEMFRVLGLQLPSGVNSLDYNNIIRQSRNIVNSILPENEQNYSQNTDLEPTDLSETKERSSETKGTDAVGTETKATVETVYPAEANNLPYDVVIERLHPAQPEREQAVKQHGQNYRITDDQLGVATPSVRFANNVAAIRLLHALEEENRLATKVEQGVLAQYVGWGGLADCFDERNSKYLELKQLLTEDEYTAARESTLSAFFTPPVVIRSVYQALKNMGFRTGNVLEPSCGVGNFLGMLPDSMKSSKLYGVELDSISGRIAQKLYPESSIAVQGFEDTSLPDSFFDLAVGNVPFGQFKVADKKYDKNNWLIHDYFFGKTLDKVRPGGIVAFITSKGTMDKANSSVRKYIAQRADLIGAIRLPNNTFKSAAGTEATSDIIFLQKRENLRLDEPEWTTRDTDAHNITMNRYFVEHPEMVLGNMQMVSGPHGMESTCQPRGDQSLEDQLSRAIGNLSAEYRQLRQPELNAELEQSNNTEEIPADPSVRNFSFAVRDGQLLYRENSVMKQPELSEPAKQRAIGLVGLRDCVYRLIELQTEEYSDAEIQVQQQELNRVYDAFVQKYGLINAKQNLSVFHEDSSISLLSALEQIDDDGNFIGKAAMFTERTIRRHEIITHVDTAQEALAISISEHAKVDLQYMSQLSGKTPQELENDLKGFIFRDTSGVTPGQVPTAVFDPSALPLVTADEYLSGNVREKLRSAKAAAAAMQQQTTQAEQYRAGKDGDSAQPVQDHTFDENIRALEEAQPTDLQAGDISVRLGATWIPAEDIEQFVFELLGTPRYYQRNRIKVCYSQFTSEWRIEGKNIDSSNIKARNTYGTQRINAYQIIEETLNLKDVRIFDTIQDADGHEKRVLNKKETAIALSKQDAIKDAFTQWIWKDPERRRRLVSQYNENFNAIRPRTYDGSHLKHMPGMNPAIQLRDHQVNAIARMLYGGNTLLAHQVGAGKTFEMVAAAMESKRLGLCSKSLIVVPNHIIEQFGSDFMTLYPTANILVATKKDFETQNRKRFCSRIATGDYDAIIIGHSQFEKIPMSVERQRKILEQQLDEITEGIASLGNSRENHFSVKQLEKTKKSISLKLQKLNDQTRKDDVVTFEQLGVDRLFVDEAHGYKNLFLYTKMRNVGGISQTEAQKSSDLYMKCRYMDELTGGKGIVFATGTPISNSMVELYTMQRYLQNDLLCKNNLQHFDAWASTFGETVTALELSPEGTGYRAKTRFAKFYNLPELMTLFKETADIQTADMLHLPVPEVHRHNVVIPPSEIQTAMVAELAKRAEAVRSGSVDPSKDNMLRITNDGRKLALDQRLIDPMLPDSPTSKSAMCAGNVYDIWQRTAEQKSAQLVFCDRVAIRCYK